MESAQFDSHFSWVASMGFCAFPCFAYAIQLHDYDPANGSET